MQKHNDYAAKTELYLNTFCNVKPNRRTGSAGNRQATAFFADTLLSFGFEIDAAPFECLDYASNGARLTHADQSFDAFVSPYSLSCDIAAELVVVSTPQELEKADCKGNFCF